MNKVLIIDDEEKLLHLLARIISLEGYEVLEATTCKAGLKKLEQEEVDVVLCDVKLPDGNGVEMVEKIKKNFPLVEVILLTAYGNVPDGVQAMKNGAFDYMMKGDDNNKIIPLLEKAVEKSVLAKRVRQLEQQLDQKYSFSNIIGESKNFLAAIGLARKVAETDTTVLLLGETGTGKEMFAQAIHGASRRKGQPFVALNCSAFSHDLLESEMFGHKAGAFTGAVKDKKGLFEEANNGTIFLDEVGEMSIDLQAKLLRVLETGELMKVGETRSIKTDVRIIAATNRTLADEVKKGHFRLDLFYRLSVFQITLPPLRERILDIEALATYFVGVFAVKTNKKIPAIKDDFLHALEQHEWPGNIRELKNVIERSVILEERDMLTIDTLPVDMQVPVTPTAKGRILSAFELASAEKLHIQKVMNYTNGNKTETARLLNIALTTLYRKLEEYKIS